MNFFEQFLFDIKAIGGEFLDRFKNIPTAAKEVVNQLPTALTGFVVVLSMLAIIAIAILIFSKIMAALEKKKAPAEEASVKTEKASCVPLDENTSAGSLVTTDVDEKTAAVIMAIVSKESGIPLNRLSFKSIKLMEEK